MQCSLSFWKKVKEYNQANEGQSRVVIHSMFEAKPDKCRVNVGVYGNDLDRCKEVLNDFAHGD